MLMRGDFDSGCGFVGRTGVRDKRGFSACRASTRGAIRGWVRCYWPPSTLNILSLLRVVHPGRSRCIPRRAAGFLHYSTASLTTGWNFVGGIRCRWNFPRGICGERWKPATNILVFPTFSAVLFRHLSGSSCRNQTNLSPVSVSSFFLQTRLEFFVCIRD